MRVFFSEKEMKQTPQKYISRNADALKNGIRSFVNGFTSPWMTWSKIMREWLEAKETPNGKSNYEYCFGESYKQKGALKMNRYFTAQRILWCRAAQWSITFNSSDRYAG